MNRGTLALVVAVACAAACSSTAEHDADAYREHLDARVAPAEDPGRDEPLTLARALAVANRRDERLGLGGEAYVQALLQRHRLVAEFLPTLSFTPSFLVGERRHGTVPASGGGGLAGATVARGATLQRFEAPLVTEANLYRGGGDVANLAGADAEIARHRDLLDDLQQSVLLDVARAFYAVLRAEAEVRVLATSLATESARLADAEGRLKNGLTTALAVAQTRAQADGTRVALVRAEGDVTRGRATLARVVGVPALAGPLLDTLVVPETAGDPQRLEEEALARRSDLSAAHAEVDAAHHAVDAALAEYAPSVGLDITGFLFRERYADASRWDALLVANVPIFSAGRIDADVRLAWSQLRSAALVESATRRAIAEQVQVALADLSTAHRRSAGLADQLAAAEETRARAQDAVTRGLAVNLDLLAASDGVERAALDLADARFDERVAWLELLRALGRPLVEAPAAAPAAAGEPSRASGNGG